jgi:hypothetical protein
MKKVIHLIAAAAAVIASLQETPAYATADNQCDRPIPVSFRCRPVTAGLQAFGEASDNSGGQGTSYVYRVSFEDGRANAQGVLLDADGNRTSKVGGGPCLRASDTTNDPAFGPDQTCAVATPFTAVTYRVAIL